MGVNNNQGQEEKIVTKPKRGGVIPGTLVPRATKAIAVIESLRPIVQPK